MLDIVAMLFMPGAPVRIRQRFNFRPTPFEAFLYWNF
jgi:hypothetical protein